MKKDPDNKTVLISVRIDKDLLETFDLVRQTTPFKSRTEMIEHSMQLSVKYAYHKFVNSGDYYEMFKD